MRRHKHNLSHYNLLTCDMGKMVPMGCLEVLPGDTFDHSTNLLIRVSPMTAPVMHPVEARVHHFFVPNRLVWDGWEDFITGGADGNDASSPPTITAVANDLFDYLYHANAAGVDVSALPLYGYNQIYNEYYRDQDLVTEEALTSTSVKNIAWEKDYFTSARPWPQKGSDVTLPVGAQAPVKADVADGNWTDMSTLSDQVYMGAGAASGNDLYADLSSATAIPINDLRKALALQRWQEARAQWGSRYVEYLRYCGVESSDGRLDRPEYLGGGKVNISFSEVLQTERASGTPASGDYSVGDMFGHGIAAMRSNRYRRFFEEHGYVHSILSVRPKTMYQNGIHRSFLKTDREEFFQKELEAIGQQEVWDNEIYALGANTKEDVFGYQDRYSEYKYHPSKVAGDFRSTLDYWHMGRQFSSAPALNQTFVECDATKRIHNVQSEDVLWVMAQHKCIARRMVKKGSRNRIL